MPRFLKIKKAIAIIFGQHFLLKRQQGYILGPFKKTNQENLSF
jgi:hypothetical protein